MASKRRLRRRNESRSSSSSSTTILSPNDPQYEADVALELQTLAQEDEGRDCCDDHNEPCPDCGGSENTCRCESDYLAALNRGYSQDRR